MTAEHIVQRNRANAEKSTGPRTPAGKVAASANARRHGATARPERSRVGLWLRIILGRPNLTLADFIPCDERSFRALALAEAEARLETCERALRDFEAGANMAAPYPDHCNDAELMTRALAGETLTPSEDRRVMRLFTALLDPRAARRMEDPDRLLRRYRNEARARRKKAFAAWIKCPNEAETPPPDTPDEPENPGFPKQGQIAKTPKKANSRNEARSAKFPTLYNRYNSLNQKLNSIPHGNPHPVSALPQEKRFSGLSPGQHWAVCCHDFRLHIETTPK